MGNVIRRPLRGLPGAVCLLLLTSLAGGVGGAAEFYDPESVVVVIPQDGRPEQAVRVIHRGDVRFLPLVSLAGALGVPWSWDPYTYRGWIETDSLRTRFALDSPLLFHGGDVVQMRDGVSYDEYGVLMPIDYLTILKETLAGGRAVAWRPAEGRFTWSGEAPRYRQVRVAEVGHRSTLRLAGARPVRSVLLWSPVAGLDILLEGAAAHPESLAVGARRGLLAVRGVAGWDGGSRIRLDIAQDALGASVDYDEREQAWELEATTSREEIARGSFHSLRHADLRKDRDTTGPILLVVQADPAIDPAEADDALQDLADLIAETLEDTLALRAVVFERESGSAMAPSANRMAARCVVALRLDGYGTGAGQVQVWTGAARLRWEPLTATDAGPSSVPRPLLWCETPALCATRSERLAATLASHLEGVVMNEPVVRGHRPSSFLEGLTMPAVLVYPASTSDPLSIERLLDPEKRAGIARAIAFGISEAMAGTPFEESGP